MFKACLHGLNTLIMEFFLANGCSCTSENKREEFDENNKAISSVAVAAFTLSFRTRINMQVSNLTE